MVSKQGGIIYSSGCWKCRINGVNYRDLRGKMVGIGENQCELMQIRLFAGQRKWGKCESRLPRQK